MPSPPSLSTNSSTSSAAGFRRLLILGEHSTLLFEALLLSDIISHTFLCLCDQCAARAHYDFALYSGCCSDIKQMPGVKLHLRIAQIVLSLLESEAL